MHWEAFLFHSSIFTLCVYTPQPLIMSGSPPQCVFSPDFLPSPQTNRGRCLPLPEPDSARGFVLLKGGFSSPPLPSACSQRIVCFGDFRSIIVGSSSYNIKSLKETVIVIWHCMN